MKILIIGLPRAGTTSLLRGIGKQNYFEKGEPYNYNMGRSKLENKYPLKEVSEYENIIVKTLVYQIPKEKYKNNENGFVCRKVGGVLLTVPTQKTAIDFATEFCSHFDRVILLDRLIWESHLESYINLFRIVKQKWDYNKSIGKFIHTPHPTKFNPHTTWVSESLTNKDFEYWVKERNLDDNLIEQKEMMAGISERLNIPITYYEKLYGEDRVEALEIINSWNLENIDSLDLLDHLDPSKKYRKEKRDLI